MTRSRQSMTSKKIIYSALTTLVLGLLLLCDGKIPSTKYIVGDQSHWNYTVVEQSWAKMQTFFAGDQLEFIYDREKFDVVLTNKFGYDTCKVTKYSKRLKASGHNIVTIPMGLSYYITSDLPGCGAGMSMAINATVRPLPVLH